MSGESAVVPVQTAAQTSFCSHAYKSKVRMLLQIAVLTALAVGVVYLAAGRDVDRMHPGEKRTHLFEDDHGTRQNPFTEFADADEDEVENEWKYGPLD